MIRLNITTHHIIQPAPEIELQIKRKAAILYLNNSPTLNAISVKVAKLLCQHLIQLNQDPSVRLILIRSRLKGVFSVGANVKDFQQYDMGSHPDCDYYRRLSLVMRSLHKPVVSVVEGKAFGEGFEIALLSDFVLCSQKAQFGFPEISLGIIGGTQILSRVVGQKVATRMIMGGKAITAEEACRLRIAYLVHSEKLEQEVDRMTERITSMPLEAIVAIKRSVKSALETSSHQGLESQAGILHSLHNKECAREGVSAYLEKRRPNFQ